MRFGVVGCGDIAVSQHLPALEREARAEVVGVVDADPQRAERAAATFDVPATYPDVATLLDRASPDALVIATPPHVTSKLAVQAIEAGANVLCEKPIATRIEDAEDIVAAVDRSDQVLQVGFKNRFSPLVRTMRRWIEEGRIGQPIIARIAVFDEAFTPEDHEHTARIQGFLEHGPPVVHEGSHQIDLLNWMFATPNRVTAVSATTNPTFPTPNYHVSVLEYGDRASATLEVGWWWPAMLEGDFHLMGPKGSIELSRSGGFVALTDGSSRQVVETQEDWMTVCFRGQLDGFIRTCEGEQQEGATAHDARDVLEVTLAIVDAAARREPIEFPRW